MTEVSPGMARGRSGGKPVNLYSAFEGVKPAPSIYAFAIALIVACAVTAAVVRVAGRLELLDRPNERSSHVRVTPRGGGIGIVAGAAAGIVAAAGLLDRPAGVLIAGAAFLGLVGLADDRLGLPVLPRLVAQAAAAVAIAWTTGGFTRLPLPRPLDLELGAAAVPVAVLWVVAVVNIFNFMDGIDGLAGAQTVITGLGVAGVAWDPAAAVIGAAVAGAGAAFLLFNWAPARIFMGDSGSLALGYTFASLPLLATLEDRPAAVSWMLMSLWLFLADATRTLAARAARGERWHAPHREHYYQRLVRSGVGHAPVAAGIAAGSLALTVGATLAWPALLGPAGWALLALATALFLAEAALVARRAVPADAR